jgi:hypothetical protein
MISILHHLLLLSQSYLEFRLDRPHPPRVPIYRVVMPYPNAYEFPVGPNQTAVISADDKELVFNVSDRWRVSNSGYVVTSSRRQGRYQLTYLHKVIMGSSAKHINSDRLDNRRSNLIESKARTKKRVFDMTLPDFEIKTVAPLLDPVLNPQEAPQQSMHCTVRYDHGKTYRGSFKHFKPHGYGMLIEENKTSTGKWVNGIMVWGVVVLFKQIPVWMDAEYQEIEEIFLVH